MAALAEIVVDALQPAALARFWAAALDGYAVRAYDDAELARLASLGLTPETDPSVAVDGPGPTLFFQQARLPKAQRNRIHLDLGVQPRGASAPERDIVPAEIKRLARLGATVREHHGSFTVLLDPEGNEFCLKMLQP